MEDNYFTILWWFLPYINMNCPQVYMYSPSPPFLNPSPTSLPPDPFGLSQSPHFECPASCIELTLVTCFLHTIMYMSQCYSVKSFHRRLLPLSPRLFFMARQISIFFFLFFFKLRKVRNAEPALSAGIVL